MNRKTHFSLSSLSAAPDVPLRYIVSSDGLAGARYPDAMGTYTLVQNLNHKLRKVTYKHDSSETEILLYNNTKGWIIESSQGDIILIRPTRWRWNINTPVPERGWKFAVSTTTGTTYFDDQSVAVHEFKPWYYDGLKVFNLVFESIFLFVSLTILVLFCFALILHIKYYCKT